MKKKEELQKLYNIKTQLNTLKFTNDKVDIIVKELNDLINNYKQEITTR